MPPMRAERAKGSDTKMKTQCRAHRFLRFAYPLLSGPVNDGQPRSGDLVEPKVNKGAEVVPTHYSDPL